MHFSIPFRRRVARRLTSQQVVANAMFDDLSANDIPSDSEDERLESGDDDDIPSDSEDERLESGDDDDMPSDSEDERLESGDDDDIPSDSEDERLESGDDDDIPSDSEDERLESDDDDDIPSDSEDERLESGDDDDNDDDDNGEVYLPPEAVRNSVDSASQSSTSEASRTGESGDEEQPVPTEKCKRSVQFIPH